MESWRNYFFLPHPIAAGHYSWFISFIWFYYFLSKNPKLFLTNFNRSIFTFYHYSLSQIPPFAQINFLLRQIPLVNQIFRSPFTKFITPAVFSFSCLIGVFIEKISPKIQKYIAILFLFFYHYFFFPQLSRKLHLL